MNMRSMGHSLSVSNSCRHDEKAVPEKKENNKDGS